MNEIGFPLVTAIDGEARASSVVIAKGVEQQHASVIKLVRKHQASFEAFGHIDFKSEVVNRPQGGGSPTEYAMLNEHQSGMPTAVQARLRTTTHAVAHSNPHTMRTRLRVIGGSAGGVIG